jgi:hypothetical protein
MKRFSCVAILLFSLFRPAVADGTFNIENIHVHDQVENIHEGIMGDDPASTAAIKPQVFIPQVEVKVRVSKDAQSKNLIAKAYFFDSTGKLIQTYDQPSSAVHYVDDVVRGNTYVAVWPTILAKDKLTSIFFPLPANLPANWSMVSVFGNAYGAVAASVPDDLEQRLAYPEHDLVAKTLLSPDVSIQDPDPVKPVIEQVVQTDNLRYPSFTLLMHLPHGVNDPKRVTGVLAMCLLADTVGQMRDTLQAIQPQGDPNPYFAYAEAHNMAIIAWGARWVWDSYANFDQLDKNQRIEWNDDFQKMVLAWNHGINLLVNKYQIPDHDYLMYGLSAGGEWVHRLALHDPGRFLAVQMHISTSYDAPTPEGSHVMWLLTTGELDGGCDNARRFYSAARDLGYPIIFKAIEGLGHGGSSVADQLGTHFFDYALAIKHKRDAANANDLTRSQPLDVSGFYSSPFYGDLMNQEMFAAHDKEMIPRGFLVPLPNKDIADAWNQ